MGVMDTMKSKYTPIAWTNPTTNATYTQGQMLQLGNDNVIGFLAQAVGTSGAATSNTYPNGPRGTFIYKAESVELAKETGTGQSFTALDQVYYSTANAELTTDATDNVLCGIALETVGTLATSVRIDFDGVVAILSA